eukprot:SAG22_NODE_1963_length_3241_cov_3.416932_3_plen_81_part_00
MAAGRRGRPHRGRELVRQRSSLLKAVITAFPCVSLHFLAVPLRSQRTVAIRHVVDIMHSPSEVYAATSEKAAEYTRLGVS